MNDLKKKLLQENRGFSLVEMLVAVMIVSIVGASLLAFVQQSSNTYNHNSAETDVQSEAQLTANAISDRVIDCETQLKFYDGGVDPTTGDPVSFSVGYQSTAGDAYTVTNAKILQMINNNSKTKVIIFFDPARKVIYYNEATWNTTNSNWNAFDSGEAEMIADNVEDFEVDTSKLTDDKILEFKLTYALRNKGYTGSYQVHMRNDVVEGSDAEPARPADNSVTKVTVTPENRLLVKKNQPLTLQFPQAFEARVVGTGTIDNGVDWSLSAAPDLTGMDLVVDPINRNQCSLMQHTISPIPDPAVKSFKVIATSREDASKVGYATVRVVKVLGVWVNPTSALRNNEDGEPIVAKNTVVNFNASVDGWNLERSDTNVTWKLYREIRGTSGFTGGANWKEPTANEAVLSGTTVSLKDQINSDYRFKIEATSTFDNTVKGEYIFYVSDTLVESNAKFLRGINIDLKTYFMANPTAIRSDVSSLLSIQKIEITGVPDFPGDFRPFIYFDNNYILYVDYDAYHDTDLSRKTRFYQELVVELKVYYTTSAGSDVRTTHITIPAVKLFKASPDIGSIVVRKGSTSDITLGTQGYNITKSSQLSAYINGTKASGNSNQYLSCRMLTTEGGRSILGTRDNAVTEAKFKLAASNSSRMYPTGPISLVLAVEDYYVVSDKALDSYVQYQVYVANVEGNTAYIVTPGGSDGSVSFPADISNKDSTHNIVRTNSANLSGCQLRQRNGTYEMKYNGSSFVYDSTYKYWRKIS